MRHTKNRELGRCKSKHISNCLKCKWVKHANKKAEIVRLDAKQDPTMCYLQEMHFRLKDTNNLKMKGWKNMCHGKSNHKRVIVM